MTPTDLPETERLCQLAEEAAELAQAALKLRRALDGTSPTPSSEQQCRAGLTEEVADVMVCLYVLGIDPESTESTYIQLQKLRRWTKRLNRED